MKRSPKNLQLLVTPRRQMKQMNQPRPRKVWLAEAQKSLDEFN
jgi:hypothetical protein